MFSIVILCEAKQYLFGHMNLPRNNRTDTQSNQMRYRAIAYTNNKKKQQQQPRFDSICHAIALLLFSFKYDFQTKSKMFESRANI